MLAEGGVLGVVAGQALVGFGEWLELATLLSILFSEALVDVHV